MYALCRCAVNACSSIGRLDGMLEHRAPDPEDAPLLAAMVRRRLE
jgi:hypothetical protein